MGSFVARKLNLSLCLKVSGLIKSELLVASFHTTPNIFMALYNILENEWKKISPEKSVG
jgi:hypothetical protein